MGSWTDANLRAFQEETGVEPATGQRREDLEKIQQMAFELIKVIELEKSGICDGDGYWHGDYPVMDAVHDIFKLVFPEATSRSAAPRRDKIEFDAV